MHSVSSMKALKRNRNSEFLVAVFDGPYDDDPFYEGRSLPPGPHAPNRNESHALRRICAQTGLTEEQVRARHVYRRELAVAARAQGPGRPPGYSRARAVRRAVTSETGMHPLHPQFAEAYKRKWEMRYHRLTASEALALVLPAPNRRAARKRKLSAGPL
jgi:hypothetical protein